MTLQNPIRQSHQVPTYGLIRSSLILLAANLLFSCLATAGEPTHANFVGNSFTLSQGGVATMFQSLATSLGKTTTADDEGSANGVTLRYFLDILDDPDHPNHEWIKNSLFVNGTPDLLVLQEQSAKPIDDYADFEASVGEFLVHIAANTDHAETLLFMTWKSEVHPFTTEELAAAYTTAGAANGVPVAPCGLAWKAVQDFPGNTIDLLASDRHHPSVAGVYLNACVFYGTIFGESPVGASFFPVELGAADALFLQSIAWKTVQDYGIEEVFSDGFETGDTSAWSSEVGGLRRILGKRIPVLMMTPLIKIR